MTDPAEPSKVHIHVRAFGGLRGALPGLDAIGLCSYDLSPGATVADLLSRLDAPRDLVWLVTVNGERVDRDHVLGDGDRVSLIPPVGGGRQW